MGFPNLNSLLDAQAHATGDMWVALLTIEHVNLLTPLRFANKTYTTIVSNGQSYLPANFNLTLGSDRFDDPARPEITIDHVDGVVLSALQGLRPAPMASIDVVRPTEPDVILLSAPDFEITPIVVEGASSMTLQLSVGRFFALPFPGVNMDRVRVPGIFTDIRTS